MKLSEFYTDKELDEIVPAISAFAGKVAGQVGKQVGGAMGQMAAPAMATPGSAPDPKAQAMAAKAMQDQKKNA